MSKNRYGRIYHSRWSPINLRFRSVEARRAFAEKFEDYHNSHDHDGEPPRFEDVSAANIGNPESTTIHDAHTVTIDGYATYEIEEYHNKDSWTGRYRYKPPTCCVAPVISIDRTFVDSETLNRHELSAIFTDMPDEDYQALLESVKTDGFMDPVIRLIGDEVLDGWHRYRAAKALNLLRHLRFQQWNEKDEGDPGAFVKARNLERRHLNPGQRAQIVVAFNERFGHGTNRHTLESSNDDSKKGSGTSNDEPKTRQELAAEAGVSTATIDRAVAVEKAGASKAVMSGEKTAGEVIKEKTVKDLWKEVSAEMKDWKQRHKAYELGSVSNTMLITSLRARQLRDETGEATLDELKDLLALLKADSESFVKRVKQTLTGAKPVPPQRYNSYTDTAVYTDGQLINLLIDSFKQQLLDSTPDVSDKAVDHLQMLRQALIKRGYSVDEQMNVADLATIIGRDYTTEMYPGVTSEQKVVVPIVQRLRAGGSLTEKEFLAGAAAAHNADANPGWFAYSLKEIYDYLDKAVTLTLEKSDVQEQGITRADLEARIPKRPSQNRSYHGPILGWRDVPESVEDTPETEPDTTDITPTIDVSNESGCRTELRRILESQGELNKGNIDYNDLCFRFKLSKKQIQQIADNVRGTAMKSAIARHNEYRDQITTLWMDNTNISDAIGLDKVHEKLVEMFDLRELAFEKKFHGLSLREIQEEAKEIWDIYQQLTKPESELLKKVIGTKDLVDVLISYADEEGEIYQLYFSDEGEGLPLTELSIAVRHVLERYSTKATAFSEIGETATQ